MKDISENLSQPLTNKGEDADIVSQDGKLLDPPNLKVQHAKENKAIAQNKKLVLYFSILQTLSVILLSVIWLTLHNLSVSINEQKHLIKYFLNKQTYPYPNKVKKHENINSSKIQKIITQARKARQNFEKSKSLHTKTIEKQIGGKK